MISIICDRKNIIRYDFAVLESYFIYNGENIVPLLMWNLWRNGVLFYEMEHFFFPFCNFYSVFMIYIISDCKNNIRYDFAVLESYFIYNGENIVPLLIWNQSRNGVLFYEMEHFFPFCNFYSVFMISIISDCKNNIRYDFAVLESYFIYNGENKGWSISWGSH